MQTWVVRMLVMVAAAGVAHPLENKTSNERGLFLGSKLRPLLSWLNVGKVSTSTKSPDNHTTAGSAVSLNTTQHAATKAVEEASANPPTINVHASTTEQNKSTSEGLFLATTSNLEEVTSSHSNFSNTSPQSISPEKIEELMISESNLTEKEISESRELNSARRLIRDVSLYSNSTEQYLDSRTSQVSSKNTSHKISQSISSEIAESNHSQLNSTEHTEQVSHSLRPNTTITLASMTKKSTTTSSKTSPETHNSVSSSIIQSISGLNDLHNGNKIKKTTKNFTTFTSSEVIRGGMNIGKKDVNAVSHLHSSVLSQLLGSDDGKDTDDSNHGTKEHSTSSTNITKSTATEGEGKKTSTDV